MNGSMGGTRTRRVLVTGATGTVGREVLRALSGTPDVVVRAATRATWTGVDAVEHVPFDFDDPGTFDRAFEGVDAFFFVSPLVAHQSTQAEPVLRAAVRNGVRHCVRLSSRATGWDQVCVLRRWHREVEAAIVASGLSSTMLRPCSFMQNLLGVPLELARTAGVFAMPLGSGRIPFVDARDLGEAVARCLLAPERHAGATYVLTGPASWSGDELAGALGVALGRDVRYVATPPEVARAKGRERGMPDWLVESGLRVYARAESGDEALVDPALSELLERVPTGLAEFLARAARQVAAQPASTVASASGQHTDGGATRHSK